MNLHQTETPTDSETQFIEEEPLVLSGSDREAFLAALDIPPPANEALKKLLRGK